jgi:hypothetical protein
MTAAFGACFRGGLFALVLAWTAPPAAADALADFHAAVEVARTEYDIAVQTLETRGQAETAAAVGRFRQAWQAVGERFAADRPQALADDEALPATFMQVDATLVGVLLVIDLGNREAARNALAPIAETLSALSVRSAPAPN